jgi:hypothetical protein
MIHPISRALALAVVHAIPERRSKLRRTNDWLFIEIPLEHGGSKVHYTEEQLTALCGGLAVEEHRWKLVRRYSGKRG